MFLSEESDRMLSLARAGFTMDEIDVLLRIRTKVNSAETHNASEVRKILFNLFNVEVEENMNRYQDLQQATEVYCDEDNNLRVKSHIEPQDKPTSTDDSEIVLDEVLSDLADRAHTGAKKYGTYLKTHNGRDALVDAYQEACDLVMYLKQKLMEEESEQQAHAPVEETILQKFRTSTQRTWKDYTWDQRNEELSNIGLGLSGESGEAAGIIKKHLHHNHPIDAEGLVSELGDVLFYVDRCASWMGLNLEYIINQNIEKRDKRYPNGFSSADSINRDKPKGRGWATPHKSD